MRRGRDQDTVSDTKGSGGLTQYNPAAPHWKTRKKLPPKLSPLFVFNYKNAAPENEMPI